MQKLPHWSIPDLHPAFFDTESATAIEMVAKLYGKAQELIEWGNELEKDLTGKIDDAYNYLKENINDTVSSHINQMIEKGEINIGFRYIEKDEELLLTVIPYDGSTGSYIYNASREHIDLI